MRRWARLLAVRQQRWSQSDLGPTCFHMFSISTLDIELRQRGSFWIRANAWAQSGMPKVLHFVQLLMVGVRAG